MTSWLTQKGRSPDLAARADCGSCGAEFWEGSWNESRLLLCGRLLVRFVGNLQIVLHTKDAGDLVSAQISSIFFRLVIHYAIELHVAVLHRDADRLTWVQCVPLQRWDAGAGTCDAQA